MAVRLSLNKRDFLVAAESGLVPPLYAEIPYAEPSDIYRLGPGNFILESAGGPSNIARYSFVGFSPCVEYSVKDGVIRIGGKTVLSNGPLRVLKTLLSRYRQRPDAQLPPFQGGAAGLLSYGFSRYLEKLPLKARDDLRIPDAHFFVFDRLFAFDRLEKKAWAIFCPGAGEIYRNGKADWHTAYEEAGAVIDSMVSRQCLPHHRPVTSSPIEVRHETTEEEYKEMVVRAKEYIAAGDIFQANLSMRFSASVGDLAPMDLYAALSRINPSPFAGMMDFGDYAIVSSSPERLLRVRDGYVETRPIAGTRPRGRDAAEDGAMRAELLLNEKERAEHIMLIDLERNDIGRVCDYGTVLVDELMITEVYSHVIHIVSNVKGKLNRRKDAFDAIRAVFPGGTITGVPKVRCMEIIDELEPVARGPYTGSMGYIGFIGNVDLNIVIRSFTVKGGMAYIQAGAGIVADSLPEREYRECLKKAEALVRTLGTV